MLSHNSGYTPTEEELLKIIDYFETKYPWIKDIEFIERD